MHINKYISANQRTLNLVGLYPTNASRCLICLLCMLLIIVPQIVQIYLNWKDLAIVLETSSVLLTILLAILKSIVWMLNRDITDTFVSFMFADYWKIAEYFDESTWNAVYASSPKLHPLSPRSARKITRYYTVLITNALVFFFCLPPIEMMIAKIRGKHDIVKHFPFTATYPILCYESPYFEMVYLSQVVATGVCGLVVLATDTLIATAILHTCAHFKILQENLRNLESSTNELKYYEDNLEKVKELSETLKRKVNSIVKHHQIVIRFAEDAEKIFSPIMLLQVLASNLIICLVGLQVSTTLTNQSELVKFFSYLLMALFQLLLFCWPGDDLITQSIKVSEAFYSTNWYEISNLIGVEVQLVILRSQKPCRITAGKFCVMCLESFSAVMNKALSYFMVLRSLNLEIQEI